MADLIIIILSIAGIYLYYWYIMKPGGKEKRREMPQDDHVL